MKRKLLRQMLREWRDNIWLLMALMIVFTVVWGGLLMLWVEGGSRFSPTGFDVTGVYSLSPRLTAEGQSIEDPERRVADLNLLKRRLQSHPSVESVMIHYGALPYNYNYTGNVLTFEDDSLPKYYGNLRIASPEYVDVLRLESLTGASSDRLRAILEGDEILISNNKYLEDEGIDVRRLIGKKAFFGRDSTKLYRIGDVVRIVRRTEYEPAWEGMIIRKTDDLATGDIALRVHPGREKEFERAFKEDKELRIAGTIFLTDLKSAADIREASQRSVEINLRQMLILVGFVLVTIFLGLLGTFWFRVQQRVGEIAIRKICGATRRQILTRIISEGLLLLLISVIIISVILWTFILPDLLPEIGDKNLWKTALIAEGIALLMVAFGTIFSLLYPALKAMRIEPAIAVKTE